MNGEKLGVSPICVVGWDVGQTDETCFAESIVQPDGSILVVKVLYGDDAREAILAHQRTTVQPG